MNGYNLQAALGILKIDDHRGSLRYVLMTRSRQSGGVTERVAAIFQSDEAITFGGIEPFDRALHGSL